MPTGLYRILYERKKAKASGEEFEFNWMALVPDWINPAIASFQGLAKGYQEQKKKKEVLSLEKIKKVSLNKCREQKELMLK